MLIHKINDNRSNPTQLSTHTHLLKPYLISNKNNIKIILPHKMYIQSAYSLFPEEDASPWMMFIYLLAIPQHTYYEINDTQILLYNVNTCYICKGIREGRKRFLIYTHTHKYNNNYMRKITHDNYSLHFIAGYVIVSGIYTYIFPLTTSYPLCL